MKNMKVYIGSFLEEEIEEMAQALRREGIRIEIKPHLSVDIESIHYIEGKIGELKEKYNGTELEYVINKWEEYIDAIKNVFEEGIKLKEFENKLLDKLFPERKEVPDLRELIKDRMEEIKETEDWNKIDKIVKDALKEMDRDTTEKVFRQFEKEMETLSEIMIFLRMNGISFEDEKLHGKISENPYIKIEIETSPEDAEELDLKYKAIVRIEKLVDLYVNFMDFIYEIEKIEELTKKYPELVDAMVVSDVAGILIDKIEGKVDINDFIEENRFIKEGENEIMLTEDAIREILSSLEKEEIIKVKKDKISLRKTE